MKKNNKLIAASILGTVLAVSAFGMEIQHFNHASNATEGIASASTTSANYNDEYSSRSQDISGYFEGSFAIDSATVKDTSVEFSFEVNAGLTLDLANSGISYTASDIPLSTKVLTFEDSNLSQVTVEDSSVLINEGEADEYSVATKIYTYKLTGLSPDTAYTIDTLKINGSSYSLDTTAASFVTVGDSVSASFGVVDGSATQTSVQFTFTLPTGTVIDPATSSIEYKNLEKNTLATEVPLNDATITQDSAAADVYTYTIDGLPKGTDYEFTALTINGTKHTLSGKTFSTLELLVTDSFKVDSTTDDTVQFTFDLGAGTVLDTSTSSIEYQSESNPLSKTTVSLADLTEIDNGTADKYTFEIDGLRNSKTYEFTKLTINGETFKLGDIPFTTTIDSVSSTFDIVETEMTQDSVQFTFTLESGDVLVPADSSITFKGVSGYEVERKLNDTSITKISGDDTTNVYVYELGGLSEGTDYEFTEFKINGYRYELTDQKFTTDTYYINNSFDIIDSSVDGSSVKFEFTMDSDFPPVTGDYVSYRSTSDSGYPIIVDLEDLPSSNVVNGDGTTTYTYTLTGLDSGVEYSINAIKLNGDLHTLTGQTFTTTSVYVADSFDVIDTSVDLDSAQFTFTMQTGVALDADESSVSYTTEGDREVTKYISELGTDLDTDSADVYTYELGGLNEETNYEFTELEVNGNEFALTGQTFKTNTIYVSDSFDIVDSSVNGSSAQFKFTMGTGMAPVAGDRILYTRTDKPGQVFHADLVDGLSSEYDAATNTYTYTLDGLDAEVNYEITALRLSGNYYSLVDQTFTTTAIYEHDSFTVLDATKTTDSIQFSFTMLDGVIPGVNSSISYKNASTGLSTTVDLTADNLIDSNATTGVQTYEITGLTSATDYEFTSLELNGNVYSLTGQTFTTKQLYTDGTFSVMGETIDDKSAAFEFTVEPEVTINEDLSSITYQEVDGETGEAIAGTEVTSKLSDLTAATPATTGYEAYTIEGLLENHSYEVTNLEINLHNFALTGQTFTTRTIYEVGTFEVDTTTVTDSSVEFSFQLGTGTDLDVDNSFITIENLTDTSAPAQDIHFNSMVEVAHDTGTNIYTYKVNGLDETTNYKVSGLNINGYDYGISAANTFSTLTVYVADSFHVPAGTETDTTGQFSFEVGAGTTIDLTQSKVTYISDETGATEVTETLGALTNVSTTEDVAAGRYVFEIDELVKETSYEITNLTLFVVDADADAADYTSRSYDFDSTVGDDNVIYTWVMYVEDTFGVDETQTTDQTAVFSFEMGAGPTLDKATSSVTLSTDSTVTTDDVVLSLATDVKDLTVPATDGNVHTFKISGLAEKTEYTLTTLVVNGYTYDLTADTTTTDDTFTTQTVYVEESFVVGEVTDESATFTFELGDAVTSTTWNASASYITIKDSAGTKETIALDDVDRIEGASYNALANTFTATITGLDEASSYTFTELIVNEDRNTYDLSDDTVVPTFTTDEVVIGDTITVLDDETKTEASIQFSFELGADFSTNKYDATKSTISYNEVGETDADTVVTLGDLTGGKATDSDVYTYTLDGLAENQAYAFTNLTINNTSLAADGSTPKNSYALTDKTFTTRNVYVADSFQVIATSITDTSMKFQFEMGEGVALIPATSSITYHPMNADDTPGADVTVTLDTLTDETPDTQIHTYELTGLLEDTEYVFTNLTVNGYSYDISVSSPTQTIYVDDSFAYVDASVTNNSAKFSFETGEGTTLDAATSSIFYNEVGETDEDTEVTLDTLVEDTTTTNVHTFTLTGLTRATDYKFTKIKVNGYEYDIAAANTFTTEDVYIDSSFAIVTDSETNDSVTFQFTLSDYFATVFDAATSSITIQLAGDTASAQTIALNDTNISGGKATDTSVYTYTLSGLDEQTDYEITNLTINNTEVDADSNPVNSYDFTGMTFTTDTVYEKGTFTIGEVTEDAVTFSFTLGAETVLDAANSSITYVELDEAGDAIADSGDTLTLDSFTGADDGQVDTTQVYQYTITGLDEATSYEFTELTINDGRYVYTGADLAADNTFTTDSVYIVDSFDIIEEETTDTSTQFTFTLGADFTMDPATSSIGYTYDGTSATLSLDTTVSTNLTQVSSTGNVFVYEITGLTEAKTFSFDSLVINTEYVYTITGQSFTTDNVYQLDSFTVVEGTETYDSVDFTFTVGGDITTLDSTSSVSLKAAGDTTSTEVLLSTLGTPATGTDSETGGNTYTYTLTGLSESTDYTFTDINLNGNIYSLSTGTGTLGFSTEATFVDFGLVVDSETKNSVNFSFELGTTYLSEFDDTKSSITYHSIDSEGTAGADVVATLDDTTKVTDITATDGTDGNVLTYTIIGLDPNTDYVITDLTINETSHAIDSADGSFTTSYVYSEGSFKTVGTAGIDSVQFSFELAKGEVVETGSTVSYKVKDSTDTPTVFTLPATADDETTNTDTNGTIFTYTLTGVPEELTTYEFTSIHINGYDYDITGVEFTTDTSLIHVDGYVDGSLAIDKTTVTSTSVDISFVAGNTFQNTGSSWITVKSRPVGDTGSGSQSTWSLKDYEFTSEDANPGIDDSQLYTITVTGLTANTQYSLSQFGFDPEDGTGLKVVETNETTHPFTILDEYSFTTLAAKDAVTESFTVDNSQLEQGKVQFAFDLPEGQELDEATSSLQFSSTTSRSSGSISFEDLTLVSHEGNKYVYEATGLNPEAEYSLHSLTLNGETHTLENQMVTKPAPVVAPENKVLEITLLTLLTITTLGVGTAIYFMRRKSNSASESEKETDIEIQPTQEIELA